MVFIRPLRPICSFLSDVHYPTTWTTSSACLACNFATKDLIPGHEYELLGICTTQLEAAVDTAISIHCSSVQYSQESYLKKKLHSCKMLAV